MVKANSKDKVCNLKYIAPFTNMDKDKLKALASKAGKSNLGKKKIHYTKCINCELKDTCERAYEEAQKIRAKGLECEKTGVNPFGINVEAAKNYPIDSSRCLYEIEHNTGLRNKELKSYMAFTSNDPEPLLKKIHLIFRKLEGLTDADPSFAKYAQMYYMLTNLYKIKHPDKGPGTSVNISSNSKENTTMDIKVIMNKMRSGPKDDAPIQADIIEQSDEEEEEEDDEQQ
jgi:hypothetical protein